MITLKSSESLSDCPLENFTSQFDNFDFTSLEKFEVLDENEMVVKTISSKEDFPEELEEFQILRGTCPPGFHQHFAIYSCRNLISREIHESCF